MRMEVGMLPQAQHMMKWLADRKVDYIEQPLKEGEESELKHLYKNRPLTYLC